MPSSSCNGVRHSRLALFHLLFATISKEAIGLSLPRIPTRIKLPSVRGPNRNIFHKAHNAKELVLDDANTNTTTLSSSKSISISEPLVNGSKSIKGGGASKREMLGFAIPALGIFLCNPLLSNIDNAFVGRTIGKSGLAALSPATICTDQMLYLFSFLSRATTGLVSRAYSDGTESAREAASAPFTVALSIGAVLSVCYALFTPNMLSALNVDPSLRKAAGNYIYFRGAIAWAALAQSVSLSTMLATRDAITPLKIILLAAVFNIVGDTFLCAWPFQFGVAGASAATAFATLLSSAFMLKALKRKDLLPSIRVPTKKEWSGLLEFTGPLMAITITRLIGYISMQRAASRLGLLPLAGYQLCINVIVFFLLFAEPLSQISQTKLPALLENRDNGAVIANLKSVSLLSSLASLLVAGLAFSSLRFGSALFTTDLAVRSVAQATAPAVFFTVAQAILAVSADGAMLASRDFGFILTVGVGSMLVQLNLVNRCNTIGSIIGVFGLRLGVYAVLATLRVVGGFGPLGRVVRKRDEAM